MALFRGLQFVRNYSLLSRSRALPLRGGDASNAAGYVREQACVLSFCNCLSLSLTLESTEHAISDAEQNKTILCFNRLCQLRVLVTIWYGVVSDEEEERIDYHSSHLGHTSRTQQQCIQFDL